MTLQNLLQQSHESLDSIYGAEEVQSFFYILIEHYLSLSRIDFALDPKKLIDKNTILLFDKAIQELEQQKPIQYLTGHTSFFGLEFKVTPDTLIPRPETEELVNWVITKVKKQLDESTISILDIGTGSGCIAITLAKELKNAKVTALDVSENALSIAKYNAKKNEVDIEFFNINVLDKNQIESHFSDRSFDIIISNPPYVKYEESENMRQNVLDYEPHVALFVDNKDPLKFYKAIITASKDLLNSSGFLFFEINEALGLEMLELMKSSGFVDVELRRDLFGKNRMIFGMK